MVRFFFNVFNGEEVFDLTGIVLRDASEARHHMLVLAKAWIENKEPHYTDWRVEARDTNENIVGSVHFGLRPDVI